MKEFFGSLWSALGVYKLEIIWLLLGVILARALWRFIKQKQGPDLRNAQQSDQVSVPLKYKPEWVMLFLSSLFILILGLAAITGYGTEDFRESFSQFGLALLTLVAAMREGYKSLSIQITDKGLKVNLDTYKAEKLAKIELWDDLVYLMTVKGKEVKTWLNYEQKHFTDMVKAMSLVEKFCSDHQIHLENHFDSNLNSNSTFNKEAAPPKPLKERWEEFKKIPPYEKLPD